MGAGFRVIGPVWRLVLLLVVVLWLRWWSADGLGSGWTAWWVGPLVVVGARGLGSLGAVGWAVVGSAALLGFSSGGVWLVAALAGAGVSCLVLMRGRWQVFPWWGWVFWGILIEVGVGWIVLGSVGGGAGVPVATWGWQGLVGLVVGGVGTLLLGAVFPGGGGLEERF